MKIRNFNTRTIFEGLKQGEYYVWNVNFEDGTSKPIKIKWDEVSQQDLEKHFGKPIARIDHDFSVHSADSPGPTQHTRDYHDQQDRAELGRAKPPANTLPRFEGSQDITEISKNLRDKYVNRSTGEHGHYNMARRNTQGAEQEYFSRKEKNRSKGISRALSDERLRKDKEDDVSEGFPHDVDHIPGPTKKFVNTNCLTCHGRKNMYRTPDGKLHADNKVGAKPVKCQSCGGTGDREDIPRLEEGSMGGINRAAPSNDVSFEKVLNDVTDKWKGQTTKVNELKDDSEILKNYEVKARNSVPKNMHQAANRIRGLEKVKDRKDNARIDREAAAKGDPRVQESAQASYEAKLAKFVAEAVKDDLANFTDLLGQQHKEQPKVAPKAKIQPFDLSNPKFKGFFRAGDSNLTPGKFNVKNAKDEIVHDGSAPDIKAAYDAAEKWLATTSSAQSATSNVTINFNAAFAREFGAEGATLYCAIWDGPALVISHSPQDGLQKTSIRTQAHARTPGAALLPATTISAKAANNAGLDGNSYYSLGPREEMDKDTYAFPLQWEGKVEKGAMKPFKEPIIQTSSQT